MVTHPRLGEVIPVIRPQAEAVVDYTVQDDGGGPYLARWNIANPPTQAEVDAVTDAQIEAYIVDRLYDRELLNSKVLKALALCLNDGSFPVGANMPPAQLRAIIKARM